MIKQFPLTIRRSIELLGLVLLAFVITEMKNIITPMLMALVLSIALLPIYRFLIRKKIYKSISIFITILIMFIMLAAIIFFISYQLKPLFYNFTTIKLNILNQINLISTWLSQKTGISNAQQTEIIKQQTNNFLDFAGNLLNNTMGSLSTMLIFFGLVPIYTFLILFYKNVLYNFLQLWFQKEDEESLNNSLKGIESIIQSFIVALLLQFAYMIIMLGGALLLFGISYALLIAVIFAILNLIPYVGALVGNIIGVLLTLSAAPDLGSVFTVLIIISIAQFIDNNILMPAIVGSKIKINALVSLFGVLIGGALAGIAGMFLSLPLMAIFKIICDNTTQFKKWGVLLGDEKLMKSNLVKTKNY